MNTWLATKKVDPSPIISSATMAEFKKSFHFTLEGTGNDNILAASILRLHYAFQRATMAARVLNKFKLRERLVPTN